MYLPSSLLPLVAELKVQNEIKCMITLKKCSIIFNNKLLINTMFIYPSSCQLPINYIFKLDRGFEVVLLFHATIRSILHIFNNINNQNVNLYPSIAKLAYIIDGSILKEYKMFNLTSILSLLSSVHKKSKSLQLTVLWNILIMRILSRHPNFVNLTPQQRNHMS